MSPLQRRYDIDWLRVIAVGLLLVYHIAIAFQPWGAFIGFIQNPEPLRSLWIPMSMVNIWRIPLLFFVSGMGVCFSMKKRNWRQLIQERTRRILLPFLFGILAIVPLHTLLWQRFYHQPLDYTLSQGHLWFLGNIFCYVLIGSPLFFLLKRRENGPFSNRLKRRFSHLPGLVLITAAFVLESIVFNPDTYEAYALTWHGFAHGLIAFISGFLLVFSGKDIWVYLNKIRWWLLSTAILLFLIRYFRFGLQAPGYLKAVESSAWVFSVLAIGHRYLGRTGRHPEQSGKVVRYLSQAAYPVYIIHMFFLYLGASLLFPADLPSSPKLILLTIFTFAGCFATYELAIKRIAFLRPLFGLPPGYPRNLKHESAEPMPLKSKKTLLLMIPFILLT